jgi:cold shock CspA family protein
MNGTIKTFLPDKGYGFINGTDGKDYFFHVSAILNSEKQHCVCEEADVVFEGKATPKGFKAVDIKILACDEIKYSVPEEFITTSEYGIKNWEIVEKGAWIIHGTSEHSPDDAKRILIKRANSIGANAVIELTYYKTTSSRASNRGSGTYYFTVHNYIARAVTVAKKSNRGIYKIDDLLGLNERASILKSELITKTKMSRLGQISLLSILFFIILMLLDENNSGVMIVILLLIGYFLGRHTDYDSWLETG